MMKEWKDSLAQCQSAKMLVDWVNDRLARWTFSDLAALDEPCRPRRVRDVSDIAHWHRVLTESYCAGGVLGPRAEVHNRMRGLFAAAHGRAAQLQLLSSSEDSLVA